MPNELQLLSKARRVLEEASKIEDVVNIRDQAEAVRTWARSAGEGLESQNLAADVKIRAERKAGELLAKMNMHGGDRSKLTSSHLESLGITPKQSSRWQAEAEVSDKEYEDYVRQCREDGKEITSHEIEKRGRKKKQGRKKEAESKKRIKQLSEAESKSICDWDIVNGDCLDGLKSISGASLIFADPPYNIGIDYGQGKKADKLSDDDYLDWCNRWIGACASSLADDGSMWLLACDEYIEYLAGFMNYAGLHRRSWIKWYETFGVNCTNKFNRTSRHLLYYVVDPKRFTFNVDFKGIRRKSDRQEKYNDSRANEGGKLLDDVWTIPRLTGNARERIPGFPTQLPLKLLDIVVGACTNPGDLVVDPFCGSATTGVAAINHHCRFIGVEKEKPFWNKGKVRMRESVTLFSKKK